MTRLREIILLLIACVIKFVSIVVKTTTHELLRTLGAIVSSQI